MLDDGEKCWLHLVVMVHVGVGLVGASVGERVRRFGRGFAAVVATFHANDGSEDEK